MALILLRYSQNMIKIWPCWSFIPSGNAILRGILRETTCFREAFENSTFIFHRNRVGQQSQDLPNHHNAKACSGNPGLLPELSPRGCMLNGWMVRFLCVSYVILMWFIYIFLCDSYVIPNCRTSFSNNIANKLHRRETLYEQSAHDKDRKMNTQVLHVYLQNKNTDYTHIHYTPWHISYSIL